LKGPFGFGDKELHQLGTAAAAAAFAGDLQFSKVKETNPQFFCQSWEDLTTSYQITKVIGNN
jgi:hypothetical protein